MTVMYMYLWDCFAGSLFFVFQVTSCLLLLRRCTQVAEESLSQLNGGRSFGWKQLTDECNLSPLYTLLSLCGVNSYLRLSAGLTSGLSSAFLLDLLICFPRLPSLCLFSPATVTLYGVFVVHYVDNAQ